MVVEFSGDDFIGGRIMRLHFSVREFPKSWFTTAAAFLRMPKARMSSAASGLADGK